MERIPKLNRVKVHGTRINYVPVQMDTVTSSYSVCSDVSWLKTPVGIDVSLLALNDLYRR